MQTILPRLLLPLLLLLPVGQGRPLRPATAMQTDVAPRAQIGPLQAWMARSASGTCELRLRNAGAVAIAAWTITVRSDEARYVTIVREDHWRDAYHLPLGAGRIEAGETDAVAIHEDGAVGPLTVRIALLVRSDGVAYGTPDVVPGIGHADEERRGLLTRRARQAAEAMRLTEAIEARLASDGVVPLFEARRISALLDAEGELNWWRVRELVLAAEAAPAGDPAASSRVREAIALLRAAHREGTADVVLQRAEPLRPVMVGRCD